MAKGGNFERETCRRLSMWWAGHDDVFWRSNASGARATTRAKTGKRTRGHHGDITATNPVGQPLIDLITFELKRGYSSRTIADLLDIDHTCPTKLQTWELFIAKAIHDHEEAGSYAWAIISRRDRKLPFIYMPLFLATDLARLGAAWHVSHSRCQLRCTVRRKAAPPINVTVMGMPLDDFLVLCSASLFKQLAEIA